jgi:hypothetical protein
MLLRLSAALLALSVPALAQDKPAPAEPAKVEMVPPSFEMFRLAPGKTEDFIRSLADWDEVSRAGGQPLYQMFLHEGGEDWDVLLYKPARPKPTPAQEAAMAAKAKQLGLASGALYYVEIREQMAEHIHFDAKGPMSPASWISEIDRLRAEKKARK